MGNHLLKKKLSILEQKLKYKFNNTDLLIESLTHPSMKQVNKFVRDYERLEFLGDAVIGFVVTQIIYNQYSQFNEGNLAKIKSVLVSSKILVKIASTLNLEKFLIITQGEENCGGRNNCNNIENAMEALLAAIYLDSNINNVEKIIYRLWHNYIQDIDFSTDDPKTYLQELLQKKKKASPSYQVINQQGPVHYPLFTVKLTSDDNYQFGKGRTIKDAEKNAAQKLINFFKS